VDDCFRDKEEDNEIAFVCLSLYLSIDFNDIELVRLLRLTDSKPELLLLGRLSELTPLIKLLVLVLLFPSKPSNATLSSLSHEYFLLFAALIAELSLFLFLVDLRFWIVAPRSK